jgi:ABC-2 type transport system permease protein
MPLAQAGYREWDGHRRSPWWAVATLVRTGLALIFRRWVFWILIVLGLLNFLFNFAFIYLKATLVVQSGDMAKFLDNYRVTGTGDAYADFMNAQAAITTLLLAFAGSTLIGSDYRQGGMVFYLSRAIGKRHYIVGKLLAIGAVVTVITTVPTLILFFEYGFLSSSLDYFTGEWRILVGILGYGAILATVQSVMLFAVAAWVPRTVPLVMTWLGLFVLLTALAHTLRAVQDNRRWLLLALWEDMYRVGQWCFGSTSDVRPLSASIGEYFAVLGGVCVFGLLLIIRRVRAVEVVR